MPAGFILHNVFLYLCSELPTEDSESNIYVILTKDAADDDEDFHSIKYTRDLTLQAFAKFLMILSLPKMVCNLSVVLVCF